MNGLETPLVARCQDWLCPHEKRASPALWGLASTLQQGYLLQGVCLADDLS